MSISLDLLVHCSHTSTNHFQKAWKMGLFHSTLAANLSIIEGERAFSHQWSIYVTTIAVMARPAEGFGSRGETTDYQSSGYPREDLGALDSWQYYSPPSWSDTATTCSVADKHTSTVSCLSGT